MQNFFNTLFCYDKCYEDAMKKDMVYTENVRHDSRDVISAGPDEHWPGRGRGVGVQRTEGLILPHGRPGPRRLRAPSAALESASLRPGPIPHPGARPLPCQPPPDEGLASPQGG